MSAQSFVFNPRERTLAATGDGFSFPTMSTTQRTTLGLGVGDAGMQVYDTDLGIDFLWDGTQWISWKTNGGVSVQTIAAARSLTGLLTGTFIEVEGYYAAGDGGGGSFWADLTDISSADNGGSIIVTSAGVRLKALYQSQMSLLQWGAKTDGTDSTIQVQAAITWAVTSKVVLQVPAEFTIIVDALTVSGGFLELVGANDPAALNSAQTGVRSVLRKKVSGTDAPLLTVATGAQVSIRGVAFDGDRFNNAGMTTPLVLLDGTGTNYDKRDLVDVSIRFANAYGLSIKSAEVTLNQVHVFDGNGGGIFLRGQDNIWSHILVGRNAGDGIYIDNSAPYPAGANRFESIDSFQNQGYGVYSIIPFNGSYTKVVTNFNLKGGWLVDSNVALVSTGRNRWVNGEFVDNNYPTYPYYTSRATQVINNTPYATGSYSNFEVTGPGYVFSSYWSNCSFTLNESGVTKVAYGFKWSCTGTGNGYSNTFINCYGDGSRPTIGLTLPSILFANSGVNSLASGDIALFSLDGSSLRDFYVGRNVTVDGSLNVGNGSQTGSSATPTLSVIHNTTVSSFLQSIISGQPTIRFRNLGSANFDFSDLTNNRVGFTFVIASGRNDLILGGNSPGPAASGFLRAADSASGTDQAGSNLTINAGRGTGAGAAPTIAFQLPTVLVSGTTTQVWSTAVQFNGTTGFNFGLGGTTGTNFKRIRHGRATLVAGVVVVADIYVTTTTRIMLSVYTPGGTRGFLDTGTRVASTSFTITSSSVLDTSVVDWVSFEP